MAKELASTILTGIASAIRSVNAHPDDALIELGRQLEVVAAELDDACSQWQGQPECDALTAPFLDRLYELNHQILLMPAATVTGVDVKVRAIKLIYEKDEEIDLNDPIETTDGLAATIVNDRLGAAS